MSGEEVERLILRFEYASDQEAFRALLGEVSRLVNAEQMNAARALAEHITARTGVYVTVVGPAPADSTLH
jgi:hypothetical protein